MTSKNVIELSTQWRVALCEAFASIILSVVILTCAFLFLFTVHFTTPTKPTSQELKKIVVSGASLMPVVVGAHEVISGATHVSSFAGDEAIFVIPVSFNANDYPFVKVNIQGLGRDINAKLMWQLKGSEQTFSSQLWKSRAGLIQARPAVTNRNYEGEIASLALIFFFKPTLAIKDEDFTIRSIEFAPMSKSNFFSQVIEEWNNAPLILGSNNNFVAGQPPGSVMSVNYAISVMTVLSLVNLIIARAIKYIFTHKKPHSSLVYSMTVILIFGFFLNDYFRWQWRLSYFEFVYDQYFGMELSEKIIRAEIRCSRYPEDCARWLLPNF